MIPGATEDDERVIRPERDLSGRDDDRDLQSVADELVLHGVLSMLADGEPEAIERRINRAMEAVRAIDGTR